MTQASQVASLCQQLGMNVCVCACAYVRRLRMHFAFYQGLKVKQTD